MTIAAKTSYSASGVLSVIARGYWFTAGGEKGSFGYYPHLKNSKLQPVYPDTQLHGDLKMAASWLLEIDTTRKISVCSLFGSGGGDDKEQPVAAKPSRVFVGDLQLDGDTPWDSGRFEVKSRIQINDETRTVDRHFLVDLEMARLDGMTMNAPLHIGPFFSKEELSAAMSLLEDAATLISGFGAFRSRGYGRGIVAITLSEDIPATALTTIGPLPQLIALTSCTNLRNKPVDPGNAQTLTTELAITPEQFKGWFAKAYQETFTQWPTPVQMSKMIISPLYPAPSSDFLALPPAMSTLANEKGEIRDVFGESFVQTQASMGISTENFFASKTKPLGSGWSVTSNGAAFKVDAGRRFRNNIDDATFTTTEAGLFSQEYLPTGTIFTGVVTCKEGDPEFTIKLNHLLAMRKPIIKGTPLTVSVSALSEVVSTETARLIVAPIPFRSDIRNESGNQVAIGTSRRYNATLRRPRRSTVVIMPGSIVTDDQAGSVPWAGFRCSLEKIVTSPQKQDLPKDDPLIPIELTAAEKKLTRAQAGQLRQMLHPAMSPDALNNILTHRIKKYKKKDNTEAKVLLPLLQRILDFLTQPTNGHHVMKQYVRAFLDHYAIAQWEENTRKSMQKGGADHECPQ